MGDKHRGLSGGHIVIFHIDVIFGNGIKRSGRGDVKRKVAITLKNQGEIKNKRLSHYAESRPGKTGRLFCVVGLERRKIFLVEN